MWCNKTFIEISPSKSIRETKHVDRCYIDHVSAYHEMWSPTTLNGIKLKAAPGTFDSVVDVVNFQIPRKFLYISGKSRDLIVNRFPHHRLDAI